ncbi:hypothetical protein AB0O34_15590 [Sphaerisporangium sp. NPDC088356]|uniref:hypothetical protein n=1 Tax=Sphaerisporangium sp. NPDC088356 TaxID=3154871 RepID=UPI00342B43C7
MNIPEERDLPVGRHQQLKEFVMTEIQSTPQRSLFRPAILAPALGLAAAAAVAVPLFLGGGTPAYAVARNPDGTVNITFHDAKNAKGLEQDLRDMGYNIKVDYVPDGKQCSPKPRSQSWVSKESAPLSVFPGQAETNEPSFTIDPSVIKEGQTGVLMFSIGTYKGDPIEGNAVVDDTTQKTIIGGIWARVSNGPVADCTLVDSDETPLPNDY